MTLFQNTLRQAAIAGVAMLTTAVAFGTVSSFSFNGKELDAEALASCKVD